MVTYADKNVVGCIESLLGGRNINEDSAGVHESPIGTIVTVCDGMGGLNSGKVASMLAVKTIIDDVIAAEKGDEPASVLRNAICHANQVIVKESGVRRMGTTVTALIVNRRSAVVAHLGDSRIYQLRAGKKVFRTDDHSKVFEYVKLGAMKEDEARVAEDSNVILKALGIFDAVEPEIHELPYLSGDRFILCTDGFWNPKPEPEFLKMVCRSGSPTKILSSLCKEVDFMGICNGGQHDNLTAAMFDVKNDSKLKVKMRKSLKVLIVVLVTLLAASVSLNVYMLRRVNNEQTEILTSSNDQAEVANADNTEEE